MSAYTYLSKMAPALTREAASAKAVLLYKATIKQLPRILNTYQIDMTYAEARQKVKKMFYANADVKDPRVAEIMVYRAAMQLDEITNQFTHEENVKMFFDPEPTRPRDRFMKQKPDYFDQLLSEFDFEV